MPKQSKPVNDPRIDTLVADVATLKEQMVSQIATTNQIHDILAAFSVAYRIAKWIAAIGAACAAVWHGALFLKGKM